MFFLIITIVIVGRTMIGNHFKKKFSKRQPPGIIVTEVIEKEFSEKIETFGTAISKKSKTTYAMWCEKHGFKYADLNSLSDLIKDAIKKRN